MPTYICTVLTNRLSPEQKARIASEITRVHNQVTGAATYFAQVIFQEVAVGNYFIGGKPLADDQIFLHGQIRAGRSAIDRKRLLLSLHQVVAESSGAQSSSVWVYLVELPARAMIEYGHVLPEPGDEAQWFDALPEQDRRWMERSSR